MALRAASGFGQVHRSVDHARRPVDCLRGVGAADRCGLVLGGRLQAEQAAEGGSKSLPAGPAAASSETAERWASALLVRPVSRRQIASLALMPARTAEDAAAVYRSRSASRRAASRNSRALRRCAGDSAWAPTSGDLEREGDRLERADHGTSVPADPREQAFAVGGH